MSSNNSVFNVDSFNYPTNVIELITTNKHDIKVQLGPKSFKYQPITNGNELTAPEILYKNKDQYTSQKKVKLFSTSTALKVLPPYNNAPFKYNNKLLVSFGKYNEDNQSFRKLYFFCKALSIAGDFLLVSHMLSLNITDYKTDKDFIEAIKTKLKSKQDDEFEDYLHYIHMKEVFVKSEDLDVPDLVKLVGSHRKALDELIPKETRSKDPVWKFIGKDYKGTQSPVTAADKTMKDKKTEEEVMMRVANTSLVFTMKTPKVNSDFYCTKIVKGKNLETLTEETLKKIVEGRASYNFVCTIKLDYRKFTTGPTNGIKMEVTQCQMKQLAQIQEVSLFDDDDEDDGYHDEDIDFVPESILDEEINDDYTEI